MLKFEYSRRWRDLGRQLLGGNGIAQAAVDLFEDHDRELEDYLSGLSSGGGSLSVAAWTFNGESAINVGPNDSATTTLTFPDAFPTDSAVIVRATLIASTSSDLAVQALFRNGPSIVAETSQAHLGSTAYFDLAYGSLAAQGLMAPGGSSISMDLINNGPNNASFSAICVTAETGFTVYG